MAANPIVEIETTKGTIVAELFADKAPNTVANFVDLVNQNYYDGIIFHRVIREFMVQTGDPTGTGRGGRTDKGLPAKKIQDEFSEIKDRKRRWALRNPDKVAEYKRRYKVSGKKDEYNKKYYRQHRPVEN